MVARIGPYVGGVEGGSSTNPDLQQLVTTTGGRTYRRTRRRVRSDFHGTVILSSPAGGWRVHWDECNKTSDHKSSNLKFLADRSDEFDAALVDTWLNQPGMHTGNHEAMMKWTKDRTTDSLLDPVAVLPGVPIPNIALAAAIPGAPVPDAMLAADLPGVPVPDAMLAADLPAVPEAMLAADLPAIPVPEAMLAEDLTVVPEIVQGLPDQLSQYFINDDVTDSDNEENDNLVDERDVEREIRGILFTDRHTLRQAPYCRDKARLIQKKTRVVIRGPGTIFTLWVVHDDVKECGVPPLKEYYKMRGVKKFDFGVSARNVCHKAKNQNRISLMDLLMHLWPSCEFLQIDKMNKHREDINALLCGRNIVAQAR